MFALFFEWCSAAPSPCPPAPKSLPLEAHSRLVTPSTARRFGSSPPAARRGGTDRAELPFPSDGAVPCLAVLLGFPYALRSPDIGCFPYVAFIFGFWQEILADTSAWRLWVWKQQPLRVGCVVVLAGATLRAMSPTCRDGAGGRSGCPPGWLLCCCQNQAQKGEGKGADGDGPR